MVACVLLAGCGTTSSMAPPEIYAPAPRASNAQVTAGSELVAYLARIRDMGEKPLAAEAQRQREIARARGSDLETVKLGLALSLAPSGDDTGRLR